MNKFGTMAMVAGAVAALVGCSSNAYLAPMPVPPAPPPVVANPGFDTPSPQPERPELVSPGGDTQRPELVSTGNETSQPVEDPSLFPSYEARIHSVIASSSGSAATIRFVNYDSGKRYTTLASSNRGVFPLPDTENAGIAFMANEDNETLAVVIGSLKPGHYDCATSMFDVGFAFANDTITSDTSAWADRRGGSCSFDVYEGDKPGDLQGTFTGILTTNEGHQYSIENGYFYANQPQVTPAKPTWHGQANPTPPSHAYHH